MFKNKEYVYCVYQEKSFAKAAEKLHISPPALSAMIKRIEAEAGMPIFNRKTSPISLTAFGAEYIKGIETINSLEDHMESVKDRLQTLQTGYLTLCVSNTGTDYEVAEKIANFKKAFPQITLNLININTTLTKQLLDTREADLVISTRPLSPQEYKQYPIYKEALVLVVPKEYAINERYKQYQLTYENMNQILDSALPGVYLSWFRDIPFILSRSQNYLRTCTDILFQEAGVVPQVTMEVEESLMARNFAGYGIGATIMSHKLLEHFAFEQHFCLYKLHSSFAQRTACVYYRLGSYVTPAMAKFLEYMAQTSSLE